MDTLTYLRVGAKAKTHESVSIVGKLNIKKFYGHEPGTILCVAVQWGEGGPEIAEFVKFPVDLNGIYDSADFNQQSLIPVAL